MSTMMTLDAMATPCIPNAALFHHPLVEEACAPTTAEDRRAQQQLVSQATAACTDCPLMTECLYRAVVEHNVAGIAGGTTPRQRRAIRAELGIRVQDEDLDRFAGASSGRQVDHHEVLRLRAANPSESLETLAQRMGCSLSTIKRHLRKARTEPSPAPRLQAVRPSREQVLHALRVVTERGCTTSRTSRGHRAA